jgi:putative thiamine transport system permease protein
VLAGLVALPLLAVVGACIASAWNVQALAAMQDPASVPGLWAAWRMSAWTGLGSSLCTYALCAWLVSRSFGTTVWQRVMQVLGPMLAVPHAAFAVGLMFLVAPSGWLLRILSPWLTGFTQPPAWLTSQDPWGLGMMMVLTLKELPFLLLGLATQLQRDDTAAMLLREWQVAQTMGYARSTAFWRVVWPQLVPRLRWPLLAVLAYGLTVVDIAQIAGPSNPSTLSVLAWQWLQDADDMRNAQGAIAGWLLTCTVAVVAVAWMTCTWLWKRASRLPSGRRGRHGKWLPSGGGSLILWALCGFYVAVLMALMVGSVSGVWPFPVVLPVTWSFEAWRSVWGSASTIWITVAVAAGSTTLAMLWAVAWLECAPAMWDKWMRGPLYLPLLLPSVLWVVGLHQLALSMRFTASWAALVGAHTLATLPYVVIALSPAYIGFDKRYASISASMGRTYGAFLMRVKWPMLRASLSAAAAVGVAVSVAQYLPTLYVGEGRFPTVTTEAVTLSSGGQRSLVAAYAWLQWLIPVIGFAIATWLGQPKNFKAALTSIRVHHDT